jgi:hypothetical protein
MLIADALRGRTVLLVHEEPFQADYLATVIAGAGATPLRVTPTTEEAVDRLASPPHPDAIVLGVWHDQASSTCVVEAAAHHRIPTLIVRPDRSLDADGADGVGAPFAGFQIVQSLVALLGHAVAETDRVGEPPQEPGS